MLSLPDHQSSSSGWDFRCTHSFVIVYAFERSSNRKVMAIHSIFLGDFQVLSLSQVQKLEDFGDFLDFKSVTTSHYQLAGGQHCIRILCLQNIDNIRYMRGILVRLLENEETKGRDSNIWCPQ
ncbi:hypothetical protein QTP88_002496 [Uroleucon formosanum]